MLRNIKLKKYNGIEIDLCDEMTRYFLSMKDKKFQVWWMSKFPVKDGHDIQNIKFEFESETESQYLVYFSDNKEFKNPFIYETKNKVINDVGIFIPGKTYYWKVVDKNSGEESDVDYFKTLNDRVRWINAGTVFNMRDLGGWETTDNKRVKYGFIYRGGQLKLDNRWEKSYMNDYSYQVFDYLGIKTEIELRGGFDHKLSQIHDDTKNIYINGIGYEQIFDMTEEQKQQYQALFSAMADVDTYPLYFHCSWGADRTGVLAFLISGVLGVDYDSLCEEYELTSLSASGRRSSKDHPWNEMYPKLIKEYGDNKSFKDIINEYLISYIGIKQEEIDSIRNIMLEDEKNSKNTHTITYRVDGKVYFESEVFDGGHASMVEPGVFTDKCLLYWLHNDEKYDINTPIHSDITLDAVMENIEYEDCERISLKDLGLGEEYHLTKATDYPYIRKNPDKGVVFSFDYKIESFDEKFDDGVHVEIGTLWDYKAHVWFQDMKYQHIYLKKDSNSISFLNEFEYGKTYRIDVGVAITKNGKNKGKQMLFFKINGATISIVEANVDLSISSIGLAGTKGIMYNID